MQLNIKQQQAAGVLDGPVLVLAGAGSGKTATLTNRIVNLIQSGIHPQAIVALTFTNRAAKEMKQRITAAIVDDPAVSFPVHEYGMVPWVGTFHALGVFIIKEQHQAIGIKKHFVIYDRDDSRRAVKQAVLACGLDPKQWDSKSVLGFISRNKGNYVFLDDFKKSGSDSFYIENILEIWEKYESLKSADDALDFDDLLCTTAQLLQNHPDIRAHYHKRFTHIHVDEYQDTNKVQSTIIKLLVNPESNNVFAVGDPDQLIYGWRGAQISNIMKFEKDFSSTQTVILEQNYRSTGAIIAGSNAVIAENKNRFEKNLFTEQPTGDEISLYSAYDAREEALYLSRYITQLLSDGTDPGEIAVLYRTNFQSRLLEETCLKYNIPYQVLGTKFFDRAEVKDVLSYIKSAFNPDALVDVRRIINTPRRGIGKVSLLKIFAGKEAEISPRTQQELAHFRYILERIREFALVNSPSETVLFVIEQSGLAAMYRDSIKEEDAERLANMFELSSVAEKYDSLPQDQAVEKFLEDIALMSDQDTKSDNAARVTLMTIHASKGLEFDTVFITGCEEDLFSPPSNADTSNKEEKSEEERRLFYVAMTRARKKIYLSWAGLRTVFGQTVVNTMVGFIMDIPTENLRDEPSVISSYAGTSRQTDYATDLDYATDDGETVIEYLN